MEEENVDNLNWTEEGLFKLPCKELKKLARHSNVNANYKKADLVKALLDANVPSTMTEDTPRKTNENKVLRLTRSKSSVFQSSDFTDNSSKSELNENNKILMEGKRSEILHENKNKRRVQQTAISKQNDIQFDIDSMFQIESSLKIKKKNAAGVAAAKPLSEITNTDALKNGEDNLSVDCVKPSKTKPLKVEIAKSETNSDAKYETESQPISINARMDKDTNEIHLSSSTSSNESKASKMSKRQTRSKASKKEGNESDDGRVVKQHDENMSSNDREETNDELNSFKGISSETEKKSKRSGRKKTNVDDNINIAGDLIQMDVIKLSKRSFCNGNKVISDQLNTALNASLKSEEQETINKGQQNVINENLTKSTEVDHEIEIRLPTISDNSFTGEEKAIDATTALNESDKDNLKTKNKKQGRKKKHITHDSEANISLNQNNNRVKKIVRPSSEDDVRKSPVEIDTDVSIVPNETNNSFKRSTRRKLANLENESNLKKVKSPSHSQDTHEHCEQSKEVTAASDLKRANTFIIDDNKTDSEILQQPSVSGLKRSNTYTIDENDKDSEKPEVQPSVSGIKRSNTFIVDDNNKGEPSENKLKEHAKPSTIGKSIGNRILSSTQKLKSGQVLSKHTSGSSLKKIRETAVTPGSSYKSKFGISKTKVPNFKSIHQKLFKNMESVGDNQKRKLDRAQALLCSPIVPKCATLYKTPKKDLNLSKSFDSNNYKAGPSRIQSNRKTPSVDQAKTPAARQKPLMPGTSSVSRFGFKNRMNKLDAIRIVVNKLPPPISLEKKKEAERSLIKGVRMNKRFMLQMQMRQKMEEQ